MQVPPIFYLPIAITVINNNTNVFLAINTRSYTARDTTVPSSRGPSSLIYELHKTGHQLCIEQPYLRDSPHCLS